MDIQRNILIEGIDTIVGNIIDDKYNKREYREGDRERVDISVEVKNWLIDYLVDVNMEAGPVKINEISGTMRRYVIEITGEDNSFVIAIHDPMGLHSRPAESITGADYIVEYPVSENRDRFVLVQTKRLDSSHGVPPKQFFAMGAVYMFGQYLIQSGKRWIDRFEDGIDYVNAFQNPHNEFMFVKYAGVDLYVPLSAILNTHKFRKGWINLKGALSRAPSDDLKMYHEDVREMFADAAKAKEPFYGSLSDFRTALDVGDIGLEHRASSHKARTKADVFARFAEILNRPSIVLLEVENEIFGEVSDHLAGRM